MTPLAEPLIDTPCLTGMTFHVDTPIVSQTFTTPAGETWHVLGRDRFLNKVFYRIRRYDADARVTTHVREDDLLAWQTAGQLTFQ